MIVRVRYEGPALNAGWMRLADFGPALTGLGAAVDESCRLLSVPDSKLVVGIAPEFRRGSFEFPVVLATLALVSDPSLLSALDHARQIVKAFFGEELGLLDILRRVRGKKPDKVELLPDGGANLVINGSNNIIVGPVFQLATNRAVVHGVGSFLKPLAEDGIDRVTTEGPDGAALVAIAKDEAADIRAASDRALFPARTESVSRDTVVELVRPSLDHDRRTWEVREVGAAHVLRAKMEDETWLGRIEARDVVFVAGDAYRVRLEFELEFGPRGGIETRNPRITKVHELIRPHSTRVLIP
ncbi:MAG: hypothetical protein IT460_06940 [Planctomycetes bacterium]|nr:hypothetical protein [Planctomycetota bacterium]